MSAALKARPLFSIRHSYHNSDPCTAFERVDLIARCLSLYLCLPGTISRTTKQVATDLQNDTVYRSMP